MDGTLLVILVGLVAVIVTPVAVMITLALREERRVNTRNDRVLRTGPAARAQIVTAPVSMTSSGFWRFVVRVTDGAGVRDAQVEQFLGKHIVGGFFPGREVIVRIDPETRDRAVLDLAAMGYGA